MHHSELVSSRGLSHRLEQIIMIRAPDTDLKVNPEQAATVSTGHALRQATCRFIMKGLLQEC